MMGVPMTQPTPAGTFRAYRVELGGQGAAAAVKVLSEEDLPAGDVAVRVAYSSLNYKDALSARGRPGVTKNYPHTPGIDAAGVVERSGDARFEPGQRVLVTSYDLGMNTPGGFGELIRVPGDWVVPLPAGLSLRESMVLGTAGLTAGLALAALEHHGLAPKAGPVVVTGASGGVGSLAVALLARRGYEVVASSGTAEAREWLSGIGAARVIDRQELGAVSERSLLRAAYAGAIDTVGGHTLVNLLKSLRWGGAAAACGLVQSPRLELTVFPFILRGVALLGVDSAACPMERRSEVWRRLAGEWKPADLEGLAREVGLEELDGAVDEILAGRTIGRVLVRVAGEPAP
jgi:acrylyl-CoA reductase (NADPH)